MFSFFLPSVLSFFLYLSVLPSFFTVANVILSRYSYFRLLTVQPALCTHLLQHHLRCVWLALPRPAVTSSTCLSVLINTDATGPRRLPTLSRHAVTKLNERAMGVMSSLGVPTLDLNAVVHSHCGANYSSCPLCDDETKYMGIQCVVLPFPLLSLSLSLSLSCRVLPSHLLSSTLSLTL